MNHSFTFAVTLMERNTERMHDVKQVFSYSKNQPLNIKQREVF